MLVLVGSKNPVKVNAAKHAFEQYFDSVEVMGIDAPSGVPEQPVNDDILGGARNRIKSLKSYANENNIGADFFAAIESGVTDKFGVWLNINFAVIESRDGYESVGTSEGFPVPKKLIGEIIDTNLGSVMDRLFNSTNMKQGKGGVYYLTRNYTREDISKSAFTMALTQFVNENLWKD